MPALTVGMEGIPVRCGLCPFPFFAKGEGVEDIDALVEREERLFVKFNSPQHVFFGFFSIPEREKTAGGFRRL